MNLSDLFAQVPPRESSGSLTSDRFEYQKDWSLVLLLQLHLSGNDYLLVLDMHEDVVVFDSSSDPQSARFYQVKTLHGEGQKAWTTAALIRQKKAKKGLKNSILGKLYSNKQKFATYAERLAVVSNAPFSIKLETGKKATIANKSISYIQIHASDRKTIEGALEKELNLTGAPQLTDLLFLEVSDLHIEQHAQHVRGKLNDFLESLTPQCATLPGTIYRLLIDEIRVKNDTTVQSGNFSELAKLKGISKEDFQKILDRAGVNSDPKKIWDKIEMSLNSGAVPVGVIVKLKLAFFQVRTDRMSKQSPSLSAMHGRVAKLTQELALSSNATSVYALSEMVLARLRQEGFDSIQFIDDYIRVLAMVSFYETGNI